MFCTQSCEHHINATSSGRVLGSNGAQQQQGQEQQPEQQNVNRSFALIPAPGLGAVASQLGVCIVTETPEGLSFDCNVPLPNCYDFDTGNESMSVKTPPGSPFSFQHIDSPFEAPLLYQAAAQPCPEEQPLSRDSQYTQFENDCQMDRSQTGKPQQQAAVHNMQSLQQMQPPQFHLQLPILFGSIQSAPAPCTHQLTSFCGFSQTIGQQPWPLQQQQQQPQQPAQCECPQLEQQQLPQQQQQVQQQQLPQQLPQLQPCQIQLIPTFLGDQSTVGRSFDLPCRIMGVQGTGACTNPMQPIFILEILPQERATQETKELNQQSLPMPSMSSVAKCATETPRKSATWAPMNTSYPCTSSPPATPPKSICKRVASNVTTVSTGQKSRKSETCFSHRLSGCRTPNSLANRNRNAKARGNALENRNGNSQSNGNGFAHRSGTILGSRNCNGIGNRYDSKDAYRTANGCTMANRNGNTNACGYGNATTYGRASAYGHARATANCSGNECTNNGWYHPRCSYWRYPAGGRQSGEWNQRF
ncbi:PREDICTED: ras guanine nucleotide exchange factor P isoform X2 [Drosophila arizonae]|uniref:Ras guanine nucleotide exchange factor P isoform X2 n=1 Tax=Drosophila arizonae TaxID=7263 RepID=A0ABM1P9F4_DROAR|nr:PREDICTED: ras guanine nucleotide exchange factor P isoform X2 [Drosophila arizonae]